MAHLKQRKSVVLRLFDAALMLGMASGACSQAPAPPPDLMATPVPTQAPTPAATPQPTLPPDTLVPPPDLTTGNPAGTDAGPCTIGPPSNHLNRRLARRSGTGTPGV